MTTGRACRRRRAKKCFARSSGSTRRATRIRAAPASACRSPATSPARMAATWRSPTARSAACAPACVFPYEAGMTLQSKTLGASPDAMAPDGSEVRLLAALACGSFAHFTLAAGQVSAPVAHRTVEEIWYFVAGAGEVWRRLGDEESVTPVAPGVALTIPLSAHFQFRAGP